MSRVFLKLRQTNGEVYRPLKEKLRINSVKLVAWRANEHGTLTSPIVIHPLDIAPDSFTASPRFSLILTLAHPP
jgi:hypothetical protein